MNRSIRPYVFGIALLLAVYSSHSPVVAQPPGAWQAYTWQLWRIDVDGANAKVLDETAGTRCGSPDWSPDGKFIAYDVLGEAGGGYQIAVIRADGTGRRIICSGSIPTWSPDGKLIACQRGGVQIMNADGSGRESLPGHAFSLRWSPDGKSILTGSGNRFLSLDLESGQQRVLGASRARISHGYGISPDGQRICYGTPDDGLWVVMIDPKTRSLASRQVVKDGTAYHASWAPDGRRVVFAWQPRLGMLTQNYVVDVEGTEKPKILPGLDMRVHNVNPDWSPDGKSIVFSRGGGLLEVE
jgi:Tol biopolymer transport system component